MAQAQDEVRTVLRSWRKRGYNDPDDFSFATSETFIQFYKTATSGIYFAMIAVVLDRPRRRRHRHHEHHVRLRVRADEGDRHPHGRRARGAGTSSSSSSSNPRSSPAWAGSSASPSASSSPGSSPRRPPCPRASSPSSIVAGHGHVLVDRPVLRHLPGQPGGQARSRRGPEGGTMIRIQHLPRSLPHGRRFPAVPQAPLVPDHPRHRHRGHDRHRHGLHHPGPQQELPVRAPVGRLRPHHHHQERGRPDGADDRRGADAQGPDLRGRQGHRKGRAPRPGRRRQHLRQPVRADRGQVPERQERHAPWSSG